MKMTTRLAGIAILMAGVPLGVQAAPVSVGFGPASGNNGPSFTFNLGVPTTTSTDATFSLTLDGDFNGLTEFAEVWLDGMYLGPVMNGVMSDDMFNFGNNDNPDTDDATGTPNPHTGTATIAMGTFAGMIADGILNVQINTSPDVDFDVNPNATVWGSISWDDYVAPPPQEEHTPEANSVPEPGTLALLGLGLVGMGFSRRKLS